MKRRQIFRAQASKSQTGSSSRRFANSGPVLPFNPASIPGCQLWLDAADTSSIALNSSSNVLTWIDKSGLNNHATGFNSPVLTTSSINGNQAIATNSSAYFIGPVSVTGTTLTVFCVARITILPNGGNDQRLVSLVNGNNVDYGRTDSTIALFNQGNTSTIALWRTSGPIANNAIVANTPFLAVSGYDGTNGYLWKDGSAGTLASGASSGTFAITKYGVGGGAYIGEFWSGSIGEVIIYNTALTTIQRQKVEGYLAHKWGLQSSLPADHPFKTAAPTYEEPVFVPTLISGSQLWLDAVDTSSLTLSGSNVTQIRDKSSNAYTFTGSAGTYPTRTATLNGLPVISSATGQYLRTTTFNQNFLTATVFFVIRPTQDLSTAPTTFPNYTVIRGSVNGVIETGISYWLGKYYPYLFQSGQGFLGGNEIGYNPVNINLLATGIVTGTGATNEFYMNGSLNIRGGENGTFNQLSSQILNCIGHPQNQTSHGYDFAEVILYGSVLTTSQRQRVEGYLAQKWGLHSSLPANHPYKTIAPTGIPRSITSQSLSVLFNSGSLSVPANAALTLGTNNHTFEFWLYQTSRNFYDVPFIYGNTAGNATNNYYMNLGQYTGVLIGNGSPGGWSLNMANGISLPALNTWSHYALVRNGNTFTLYLNGTNVASATLSISIPAQGGVMAIGGLNSGGNTINGYMANFRFVNGTAVYTSNFTPPTSPLTAIPNTQVLIQGFVDRSPNAFTVTSTGGVTLSTSVSPFV